jgi:thiamine biosynthesis protein ThiI
MKVKKCIVVRYGELFLKGKNRYLFINSLIKNLKKIAKEKELKGCQIEKNFDCLIINSENEEELSTFFLSLNKVFGISVFHFTYRLQSKLEELKIFVSNIKNYYEIDDKSDFKFDISRIDKNFPINSINLQKELGAILSEKHKWKVKLTNPTTTFFVRIYKGFIFFFLSKRKGLGGLPIGSGGKAVLLLSGGIDSPVAAHKLMKKGCKVVYVHFFFEKNGRDKILEIAEKLKEYNAFSDQVYFINVQSLMKEISHISKNSYRLIILKRMFVRLANYLAEKLEADLISGGDSLYQVASQTLDGLRAVYQVSSKLVLWPLITYDKNEIIEHSKLIGTYNISCKSYSDCCSLFEPSNPITEPKDEMIKKLEAEIWWEFLLENIFQKEVEIS